MTPENLKQLGRRIYGDASQTRLAEYLGHNVTTVKRLMSGEYTIQPHHNAMLADLEAIPKYSISEPLDNEDGETMLHHNHYPQFVARITEDAPLHGASVEIDDMFTLDRIVWLVHADAEVKEALLRDAAKECAKHL